MKRILLAVVMAAASVPMSALPEWPRKYATTVVRGRVTNLPAHMGEILGVGQLSTLHKRLMPDDIEEHQEADGVRAFSITWPMCWPQRMTLTLCGYTLLLPLCPGDTIDIDMDYQRRQQVKGDTKRVFREAIKISGGSLHRSPAGMELAGKLGMDAAVIDEDYMKEHCRADFNAYREWRWEKHLGRLKQVKAAKLKKEEKEYLRLEMEKLYVESLYGYKFMMHVIGCDSAEMAAEKAQFTLSDPHAAKLEFPRRITSAYRFGMESLGYLEANGLDGLPLGQYLQERRQAEAVVARMKAFRPVTEAEISGLASEFQPPVRELQQQIAASMKEKEQSAADGWKPTGDPSTWLKQITGRHAGRVVFVDLWATWCGPCQKGIREMATVKEDYEKRGVDFVYITDNSSSADGFLALQQKHTGDHFLFLAEEIRAMDIPGYAGSIPHYLIYGRNGKLIRHITGWAGLEQMKQELDNALRK